MSRPETSRVTLEQINECRANEMNQTHSDFSRARKSVATDEFISKLRKSEIEQFFSRFGYQSHSIDNIEGITTLTVNCKDFSVSTDGFTYAYDFHPVSGKDESGFDFERLVKYCEKTNANPEDLITTAIQTKFFAERFPNYPSRKETFDRENQNFAENHILNHQMRELFSSATAIQEATRTAAYDYATSGYTRTAYQNQKSLR